METMAILILSFLNAFAEPASIQVIEARRIVQSAVGSNIIPNRISGEIK
jgi:hypothetical protein